MLITALAFMALQAATPVDDPMAPARAGQATCVGPDDYFKSCQVLTTYKALGNGRYSYHSDVLVDPAEGAVIHMDGRIRSSGASFCERFQISDFDSLKVTVGGRTLPADEAADVRFVFRSIFAQFEGMDFCSQVMTEGTDYFYTEATIDGTRRPDFDNYFIWVDPADGWAVGQ